MIASRRFALFATSISAALMLSACQPSTESDEVMPAEEVATPSTEMPTNHEGMDMDAHAGHDMTGGDAMADEMQMTDILQDYTKSMTRMHDEMMIGMVYNDADTAFAKGMLGHHRGALDMAKIELKYGTDAAMRELAQEIITAQQAEIDIMNKWLAGHPDAAKPKPNTQAMQQAYAKSMDAMHDDMMLGIADPVPDMAFARGMLPHHMGAVDMAKIQLKYGTDAEMRKLAQDIIDAQQSEIERMQNWIAANKTAEVNNNAVSNDTVGNDATVKNEASTKAPAEQPAI